MRLLSIAACALLVAGAAATEVRNYHPDEDWQEHDHCTAIGVAPEATSNGASLVAHTDDSGRDTTDLRLVRVPAKDHPQGAVRPVYSIASAYPRLVDANRAPAYAPVDGQTPSVPLGYIPEVPHTYAYWDLNYALTNEKGVSMGESTCASRTIGFPPTMPGGKNIMCIEELSRIGLERCDTARCAVQTMGDLAVQYGYFNTESGTPDKFSYLGSSECLIVADAEEVWQFHVMTGVDGSSAIWAGFRLPEGHVSPQVNALMARNIDFSDEDGNNYMWGPENMVDQAIAAGFYDPTTDGDFDFTAAFGYFNSTEMHLGPSCPLDYNLYSGRRWWRIFNLFVPDVEFDPALGHRTTVPTYPVSLKITEKTNATKMMSVLRDHYEGTPFDLTKGPAAGPWGTPNRWGAGPNERKLEGGWERAISMHRTTWSYVAEVRKPGKGVPAAAASRVWLSWDTPHSSYYTVVYGTQNEIPPSWGWGLQCTMSRNSAWWASNVVKNWLDLRYNAMLPDVVAAREELEAEIQQSTAAAEKAALSLEDGTAAGYERSRQYLETFAVGMAELAQRKWWGLADRLMAKYSNGYVCKGGEGDRTSLGYPDWWLRDAGFNNYPSTHPPTPDNKGNGNNNNGGQNSIGAHDAAGAAGAPSSALGGLLRTAADHVDRFAHKLTGGRGGAPKRRMI